MRYFLTTIAAAALLAGCENGASLKPLDMDKVVVEEGGSGGRVAAPVARHIMQYLLGLEPTPIIDPRVEGD